MSGPQEERIKPITLGRDLLSGRAGQPGDYPMQTTEQRQGVFDGASAAFSHIFANDFAMRIHHAKNPTSELVDPSQQHGAAVMNRRPYGWLQSALQATHYRMFVSKAQEVAASPELGQWWKVAHELAAELRPPGKNPIIPRDPKTMTPLFYLKGIHLTLEEAVAYVQTIPAVVLRDVDSQATTQTVLQIAARSARPLEFVATQSSALLDAVRSAHRTSQEPGKAWGRPPVGPLHPDRLHVEETPNGPAVVLATTIGKLLAETGRDLAGPERKEFEGRRSLAHISCPAALRDVDSNDGHTAVSTLFSAYVRIASAPPFIAKDLSDTGRFAPYREALQSQPHLPYSVFEQSQAPSKGLTL